MSRKRTDTSTLDLLAWTPPEIAERFSPDRVRGHSDRIRMARSLAEASAESGLSRDDIHQQMVNHMGADFSRATLDRVMAPSADAHEFTLSKLIAFLHSVPDIRVVNELLDGTGFVAIPDRYLGAIEEAICDDQIEELESKRRLARRRWRGR